MMDRRLFNLLDRAGSLRRMVSVRVTGPSDDPASPSETVSVLMWPGFQPAMEDCLELIGSLDRSEVEQWLSSEVPDPSLVEEITEGVFRELPTALGELANLIKSSPIKRTRVVKREVTSMVAAGGEEGRVEDLVWAVGEVRSLSHKCLLWKRELGGRVSATSINILGIGEITTTIEVKGRHWGKLHPVEKRWMKLAYKRMPAFESKEGMEHYLRIHREYQELLEGLGIPVPWHDNLRHQRPDGKWVVYNRQERLPTRQVACLVIHDLDREGCLVLFRMLLDKMAPVFRHNLEHPELMIGFDGQIPNWVLIEYDPEAPKVRPDEPAVYIDTSTPMLRRDGVEQLDTELFLKSVPAVFRPLLRWTVLDQVVGRYYIPREVIKDLVASFITHGRPDLVPAVVEEANSYMADSDFAGDAKPFTVKEIRGYNREDVIIWHFFRTLKRIDRWVGETFLGREYEQRLPHGSPRTWKNLVGAGGMGLTRED